MTQNYANHTRWSPVYHFVIAPILLVWVGYMIWAAIRNPSLATVADALVSAAVYAGIGMGRVFALTVQNRVIRLEERLRLARLLPPDALASAEQLTLQQLIALRFASDAELPDLVRRTLAGEFATPKEIKQAVRDWRADWLRA